MANTDDPTHSSTNDSGEKKSELKINSKIESPPLPHPQSIAMSSSLRCKINDQDLVVPKGTSIIQAMKQEGMKIAHFCWHPGLSVAGVCRLCFVEIEGQPRLQLACNTQVQDGMVISNQTQKVKEAVKWGMDFHLINHPLDCPICDQAGECGLQDQYMEYGKYDSEMAEKKVKKHKVVDLGPTVILDSERCILCSRCVRFTSEVTQTHELGIFNRGDLSEIGTFPNQKLDNKYSLNVVDICPVGALTAKDFRFRQRVWFLKEAPTLCNGCSTGCNTQAFFNKDGLFRIRPRENKYVNGHWMCDEGRDLYKFVNRSQRWTKAFHRSGHSTSEEIPGALAKKISHLLEKFKGDQIGMILCGQYSTEEYEHVIPAFIKKFQSENIYHWVNNINNFDDFDGLLLRGDKNPNTKGLLQTLETHGIEASWKKLVAKIETGTLKALIVAGPENVKTYPDLEEKLTFLSGKVPHLIWLQSSIHPALRGENISTLEDFWLIPMKSYMEKSGSFINHMGLRQKFHSVTTIVPEALTLIEAFSLLSGEKLLPFPSHPHPSEPPLPSSDQVKVENLIKNEFTFLRGPL